MRISNGLFYVDRNRYLLHVSAAGLGDNPRGDGFIVELTKVEFFRNVAKFGLVAQEPDRHGWIEYWQVSTEKKIF